MAQIYFLGSILHNLDDEGMQLLLHAIREQAPQGAWCVVVERNFDATSMRDRSRDLDMRALFGGRERASTELLAALEMNGLEPVDSRHTDDGYCIITVVAS